MSAQQTSETVVLVIDILEAEEKFDELLAEVENGDEIYNSRNGIPVVKFVRATPEQKPMIEKFDE